MDIQTAARNVVLFGPLQHLYIVSKGKGKVLPRTDHDGPEGKHMYSSVLSLTVRVLFVEVSLIR